MKKNIYRLELSSSLLSGYYRCLIILAVDWEDVYTQIHTLISEEEWHNSQYRNDEFDIIGTSTQANAVSAILCADYCK